MSLTEEERKERRRESLRKWRSKNKQRNSDYQKKYREENREMIKERSKGYNKSYYSANKERCKIACSTYRKANPEKIKAITAKYQNANREKIADYKKSYYKEVKDTAEYRARVAKNARMQTKKLNDSYIKRFLVQNTGLKVADIPQSLIKAKRAYLKGIRLIREQENEGQKD